MENKLKSVLSGAGFYVLLGVCLVLAAVSGCYLLFGQSQEEEPAPQKAVSAPTQDLYVPAPKPEPAREEPRPRAAAPEKKERPERKERPPREKKERPAEPCREEAEPFQPAPLGEEADD